MTIVHGIIGYVFGVVFVIRWVYFIRAVNRLYLTWFLTILYLRTIACGTTIVYYRSWFLDAVVIIVFWIHDPSISLTILTNSWPLYILGLDIAGHGPFAFFDSNRIMKLWQWNDIQRARIFWLFWDEACTSIELLIHCMPTYPCNIRFRL